jgi:molybdopterin/thiamine biosynthesis adenylyltransferase
MVLVLALAAGLWFGGKALGAPARLRASMIGALLAGVIGAHLLLPDGHPLRAATGGEAAVWVALLFLAAQVMVWREGLRWLRARVPVAAVPVPGATFRSGELTRYARHIALREIGGAGQKALKNSRVLVVGAGGLGAPACLYLAAAGVGTVGVIDADVVEETNLQRQIIHADQRLGMAKVFSAEIGMKAVNPHVAVRPYNRRLTAEIAAELIADFDLVLDGSDNFETRELVNATCVALGKPLISGAITQWEGQVSLFHPAGGGPCRACVFPARPAPGMVPTCAEAGVAASLPGIIGAVMATEAIKHLTGAGETLRGRIMIQDALYAETRVIRAERRADCAVCGARG